MATAERKSPRLPCLADYLDLLLEPRAETLISDTAHNRIEALAATLPPIPRVAVECRFDEGDDQVDLQLCFARELGGFRPLAEHCRGLAPSCPPPIGDALIRLAEAMGDPDAPLAQAVSEVYFEYDLGPDAGAPYIPSIFLSLPADPAEARRMVDHALALLRLTPVPEAMAASIDRCFAACPADGYVSHVGLMLARPVDAIRLNVKGLRPAAIRAYLADSGWTGDIDDAVARFVAAVDPVDRVTLALDVGAALYPRLGFECFLDVQPPLDPTWRFVFADLVAAGLCTPEKAAAYLAVTATRTPLDAPGAWPASVLIDTMLAGKSEFAAFARRLTHFKLVLAPDGGLSAKGYFGAGQLWLAPQAASGEKRWQPSIAAVAPRRSVQTPASEDALANAIARGIAYLRHGQLPSGLWRDYNIPSGISDEWISAFIGAHLAAIDDAGARAAAQECQAALARRQRPGGGWAYNRDHPPDADSSSWALRLAILLGHGDSESVRRGQAFIAGHCLDNGGIVSFLERDPMAEIAGLDERASLDGWLYIHDCVTAAAAPFSPPRATDYVRSRQSEGRWVGYWWGQDAFPTWLGVEALRQRPAPGDDARIAAARAKASQWLDEADRVPGSVTDFDMAFALRLLLLAPDRADEAAHAARWLLARQRDAGDWAPGARLRIPHATAREPNLPGEFIKLDERAQFTTAAVIGALDLFRCSGGRA